MVGNFKKGSASKVGVNNHASSEFEQIHIYLQADDTHIDFLAQLWEQISARLGEQIFMKETFLAWTVNEILGTNKIKLFHLD